ncbi:5-methylthioadenosine/S-adenosylhomocysteine deaminase [archaeon]|nr:5-methylthioadenosine/S-adenosylhomocysteine deaminase [archaeon]
MDIIIRNAILVTMDDRHRILKNFSMGIEGGRIVEISEKIKGEADFEISAEGRVVLPGLINAHTHLAMTLFRGSADDLPLMEWLTQEIWPVEAQLEAKDVYAGSLLGCLEMIRSGTTTFNDMYYYLDEVAKSVGEAGIRGVLSFPLLDVAGEEQGEKLLGKAKEGLKRYNGIERDSKIIVFVGPHSPYTCSERLLIQAKVLAEEHNTGLHIHVSETMTEVKNSLDTHGLRPFEYLEKIGFLGENVLAAHGVHVNKAEMNLIKMRGVSIAHSPVSNMKLASGIAPVPEYIKKGINVALGTDGCASNNNLDMFEEIKISALLHKIASGDPSALKAYSALEMATINAARALGLEKETGSLEIGKRADIIIVDFQNPNLKPLSNPVSHLVYSARGCDVSTTIVNGDILMLDGELRTLDENRVMKFAEEQAGDLFARAGKEDKLFS